MKPKRMSPRQIVKLIDEGREDEIPKSKTWHRFMEHFKSSGMSPTQAANKIGIPYGSMGKFIDGTYVISQTNMTKIQKYLQSVEI